MRFTKNWKKSRLREILRAVGDLLLPRVCLTCGRRLGVHENHLCLACEADLPLTYHWLHPHNPLADRFNAVLERHRGTEPMDYAYAVALLHYKGPYRQIPRALKYHGNLAAGRHFGSMLGRRIATAPHLADIDLIIPVPLHWTRRRSRGYNQAEILARALAATLTASRLAPVSVDASSITPHPPVPLPAPPAVPPITPSASSRVLPDVPPRAVPGPSSSATPLISPFVRPDTPSSSAIPSSADPDASSRVVSGQPAHHPPVACRTDLLVRTRRTRTQIRLSVDQKAQNVASAFRVPMKRCPSFLLKRRAGQDEDRHSRPGRESPALKELASAHHILLVDDTFTTGATLYACYAALRPYTSARISIATLAAVEGTPSAGP